MAKISVQQLADEILDQRYRQPVKTIKDALAANGWEHVDKPICCGHEVEIRSMLGSAYFAQCKHCGKFVMDVTGPTFGQSSVRFIDSDRVDTNTEATWIVGQQPLEELNQD